MTIAEYIQQLHQQLQEYVTTVAKEHSDRVTFTGKMISFIQGLMADLQQYTYRYTFANSQEEIAFFKEQKPVLLSQYFFYKKLLSISLYESYKDDESRVVYYKSVLNQLSLFLTRNNRFHRYCLTGQTHLDSIYFTRTVTPFREVIDPNFSTGYDIKLAKLLANELLRNELSLSIEKFSATGAKSGINWTGKKSDAVELLFALQASGSINHGEVDVKKLVTVFENLFNIQFGNYYDFLRKIRMRKGSQASYLDALKSKLMQRLREMDE